MNVLKVCLRKKYDVSELMKGVFNRELDDSLQLHIQYIDNTPYLQWLQNMKTMNWKVIVDIIWSKEELSVEEIYEKMLQCFKENKIDLEEIDCYSGTQIIYKEPVHGSELITSCYLWNYKNGSTVREEKMIEHFGMEQKQKYYDYVSFLSVNKILSSNSPRFDFFFESHVSNPKGINEIYSKPALEGMREHSQAFLDVSTRELSFGRVFCYGV